MAIVMETPDEARKKSQVLAGGASAVVAGSGGAQAAAPAPQQQGSGRFTNISRYINANAGSDGYGNAAVQNSINGITNKAQGAADDAMGTYGKLNDMKAGAAAGDMDARDISRLNTVGGVGGYAVDENTQAEILKGTQQKYANGPGTYTGTSQDDVAKMYGTFNDQYSQSQNAAKALQSDGQDLRRQSLSEMYGQKGDYTQGHGKLDSLLTERYGQPQFQKTAGDLDKQMAGVDPNKAASKVQEINGQIGANQASYGQMANTWQQRLGDAGTRFEGLKNYLAEQNKGDPQTAEAKAAPSPGSFSGTTQKLDPQGQIPGTPSYSGPAKETPNQLPTLPTVAKPTDPRNQNKLKQSWGTSRI